MAKSQLLTNYGLVLIHVAGNPDSTLREISAAVEITERAVLAIIRNMEADNLISTEKRGRSNHYRVRFRELMKVRVGGPFTLQELIKALSEIIRRLEGGGDPDAPAPVPH
jgi:DNA-binding Lrp family transcriptional regulator